MKSAWAHAKELGFYADQLVAAMGGSDTGVVMDPDSNPYLTDAYNVAVATSDGSLLTSWATAVGFQASGRRSWFLAPNPGNYENIVRAALSFTYDQTYNGLKASDAYKWLTLNLPDTSSFEDPKWLFLPRTGAPSCDLNGDGTVNVVDVLLAIGQALGLAPCGNGDVDQSGSCTIVDVQRVLTAALGGVCRIGQ